MPRILLFNKPFQVMSQFSGDGDKQTLANYLTIPHVRPAGRLDYDSEGLLLLTDDGGLQARITHPRFKLPKTYLVQVEGSPDESALQALRSGVVLNDGITLPAKARLTDEPAWLWDRHPPIRFRAAIPTTWVELTIHEGRNRQVRRMTAAVGYPTLRLIRTTIGPWSLEGMRPGEHRWVEVNPGDLPSPPSGAHGHRQTTSPQPSRNHRLHRSPSSRTGRGS